MVVCGISAAVWAGAPVGAAAPASDKLRQAVSLTKQGKYAEAVAVYEAMLKDKPGDRESLGRLGPLLFLTGENERARRIYGEVTRKQPGWAQGYYFYAYALRKLGEHEQAIRAYTAYRRLQPKDPLALYGIGVSYQALGKDDEALKAYREFVAGAAGSQDKASLGGWIQRAQAESEVLEKKIALARTKEAVREALDAARKADRDGQPIEAEKLLKGAIEKLGQPPILGNELAGLLIRSRRFAEAIPVLRVVLGKQPTFFEARYRLALALRYHGDLAGAAEAYRAVLGQNPDHPDTHYGLAETLRLSGKLKEALALYSRYVIIERRPEEQHWVTKARGQIGEIQKQLAGASGVAARPVPPGGKGGDPELEGVTDPRIRAILEAKRRFQARQGGKDVDSPGPVDRPPVDRKPLVSDDRKGSRGDEAKRRREEARAKALEAKRLRAEEARRRKEEAARKREEARAREARAAAEKDALALLGGRKVAMSPVIGEILAEWAGQATGKGDHARAATIWKAISAARPGDLLALGRLAEAATAAGDHRLAAETYGALLMANPKEASLYLKARAAEAKAGLPLTPLPPAMALPQEILEGRRLLEKGKWPEALSIARNKLKATPGDGLSMVLEAEALFAGRYFAEAKAAAERASRAHPSLAGPHRVLGGELLRLRDRSAALAELTTFLRKLSGDPSEESNRAYVQTMVDRLRR